MRVLIAFGSKRGGTAGLADMNGDALRAAGCETVVSPATGIYDLTEFDAVIVASALYANRWHRDARRFVQRNTAALCRLPVWLVSSGPLDDSAEQRDIPPTTQVAKLANRIGARGHVTFGGRLSPDARGLPRLSHGQNPCGRLARRDPHPALGGLVGGRARISGGCGFLSPSRAGARRGLADDAQRGHILANVRTGSSTRQRLSSRYGHH